MSSGSDRFVHLGTAAVVDPEQVDGLSFRRGEVTIHLRSGRAIYVKTKYGEVEHGEDGGAEWAIAEVLAMLWPAEPETPRPDPPVVLD